MRRIFEDAGVHYFRFHGKGSKDRDVLARPNAIAAIRNYLAAAGHGDDPTGPLFRPVPNYWGKRTAQVRAFLSPKSVYEIVKGYATELGFPKKACRAHSLRVTAATVVLENGADLAFVQKWLGHAYITTTTLYDRRNANAANSPSNKSPF